MITDKQLIQALSHIRRRWDRHDRVRFLHYVNSRAPFTADTVAEGVDMIGIWWTDRMVEEFTEMLLEKEALRV